MGILLEPYKVFTATKTDGVTLDSQQYALESVSQGTPPKRGENVRPAMDHGLRWREKRMGGRTETWNMWVCDVNPTTGLPAGHSYENYVYDPNADPPVPQTNPHGWSYTAGAGEAQFHANWDELMLVLFSNSTPSGFDAPLKVMRTVKSNVSSPTDIYQLNYGEVSGEVTINDYKQFKYARFSIPIMYMDGRWYECGSDGAKTNTAMTADGNPGGTALMTRMVITLTATGSVTDPVITNVTTGSKITCSGVSLATGDTLAIDTDAFTAKKNGSTVVTGSVNRAGSTTTDWFQLRPGVSNTITKSSNATYSISYAKAFI